MNTYGIRSVNSDSFCYKMHADASNNEFLKNTRNIIVTIYKVHNFILNILGYIPFFCVYSGAIRAGTALLTKAIILAHNLYFDGSNESIKKWKDEAEVTANTQFARAALEAFLPFGHVVNFYLDGFGTIKNISAELYSVVISKIWGENLEYQKNKDPQYPFPLGFLNIV